MMNSFHGLSGLSPEAVQLSYLHVSDRFRAEVGSHVNIMTVTRLYLSHYIQTDRIG